MGILLNEEIASQAAIKPVRLYESMYTLNVNFDSTWYPFRCGNFSTAPTNIVNTQGTEAIWKYMEVFTVSQTSQESIFIGDFPDFMKVFLSC